MPNSDDSTMPPEQEKLHEILMKILTYQHSLANDRAVELEELCRDGVLSPAEADYLASHSVTYKPHRLSDYHAGDMLHMPLESGGCVFIGPCGPPLTKRRAPLSAFQPIVENFLKLPRPQDELLLHIEFTELDGMGVAPHMICFNLKSTEWRRRLPAIRGAAAEFASRPLQDEEIQGSWSLTFHIAPDAQRTSAAVIALLNRGCGLTPQTEVIYLAGALDEP